MKHVALLFASVPLLITLSSCSEEGAIGRERCLGANTRCEPAPPEQAAFDISKAKPVSSDVTREAKLLWSIELPDCPASCANGGQLIDDGSAGVWILRQPGGLGALGGLGGLGPRPPAFGYVRVDDRGVIVVQHEEAFPDDERAEISFFSRAWPDPEGGVAFARTAFLFKEGEPQPYEHRLTRIAEDGIRELIVGRSKNVSGNGLSGPEHTFDVVPNDDGFITVTLAPETQVVRKIDAAGGTIWRQVELPSGSHAALGLIAFDSGFALLTSQGLLPSYAATQKLLWFDADGNVTAQVTLPFTRSDVRSTPTLGLSDGRVAIAGPAGVIPEAGASGGFAVDLHVLRLAQDGALTGHRIVGEAFAALSLIGMAVDAEDTVYVTSLVGTRRNPRGLICALPEQGDGTCYLAPDGVSPQTIMAPGPGVLYALAGKALVKLELP